MQARFSIAALAVALLALAAPASLAQHDVAAPSSGANAIPLAPYTAPSAVGGAVLYDNGPLVNSPGTGPGGADESVLQDITLGMSIVGFGNFPFNGFGEVFSSDDFNVPPGGWDIDEMTFYAYQTGSTTASTITGLVVEIWDGVPEAPGSSVVFGDRTTNRLASTTWSGIYRVTEGTFCPSGSCTARPIMANTATVDVTLPAGTYWAVWQTAGSLSSGPFAPPITITGSTATGNALQEENDGGFTAVTDIGPQGFPFLITGPAAGPSIDIAINTHGGAMRGGSVFFRGPVTNNGGAPQSVYVYFLYGVPGVGTFKRNLGQVTLAPGQSFNYRDFPNSKNFVPLTNDAPAGTYTVTVYAADNKNHGSNTIYDTDSFQFTLPPIPPVAALPTSTSASLEAVEPGAAPNPFRDATTITYAVVEDAPVSLRVYDVMGREVADLVSGTQASGVHTATLRAGDLPGGVYVWRLSIGGEVTTGRITLAR